MSRGLAAGILGIAWAAGSLLRGGQAEVLEMGPSPIREMFPLFHLPMVYQPVDPTPVGRGRWRVSLSALRANTFEFSDLLKEQEPPEHTGRMVVTREALVALGERNPDVPVIFYFDEEAVCASLRVRFGLTDRTDVWGEFSSVSQGGGILDSTIEGFHKLGFEQFGRDLIRKSQLTLAVVTRGHLDFYSDQGSHGRPQDPTFGVMHRFAGGPTWTLSGYLTAKLPLTKAYGTYRSGWDHGGGFTVRWQPASRHVFYGGGGFTRRPGGGSAAYRNLSFGSMRDAWGAHAGWEYRRWKTVRPYLELLGQSGFLPQQPYQKLDRSSLQHDLGIHCQVARRTVLTLRYLNNITHNENTVDMGLGLGLTVGL